MMLNLFSRWRSHHSSNSDVFLSLGFSSLQVRMACAYIWITFLLIIVLIFVPFYINWWTVWYPHPELASGMWPWVSAFLLPIAAILLSAFVLISVPAGGLFGLLTVRKLVRRLRDLAQATILIANGNYALRVPIQRKDEVGILEAQFNEMASHLAESRKREQELLTQNVRLQERTRLARELHDTISQQLFSLRLLAEGMQTTPPEEMFTLQEKLALFRRTADIMTRDMRALLLELRPVQLEDLGLKEALEELAIIYHTRLDLTIATEITKFSLPDQVEHALFRIAQEAISNAVRHAQATSIKLKLAPCQDTVMLSVEDNGKGFDLLAGETQYGLGLHSMHERVHELNGTVQIQSVPSQGTCISVHFPIKEKICV